MKKIWLVIIAIVFGLLVIGGMNADNCKVVTAGTIAKEFIENLDGRQFSELPKTFTVGNVVFVNDRIWDGDEVYYYYHDANGQFEVVVSGKGKALINARTLYNCFLENSEGQSLFRSSAYDTKYENFNGLEHTLRCYAEKIDGQVLINCIANNWEQVCRLHVFQKF